MADELLTWIHGAIERLQDVRFPKTLAGVQRLQVKFKTYRTAEKPPKFVDKGAFALVVCGLWFVVCGLWFVVCGLWFVVCGLWFVFGAQSARASLLFAQPPPTCQFPQRVSAGDLEAHLFSIQTKLFSKARPVYHPPDGLLISDINGAWSMLESVEHKREMALRDQLIRLEKVEQLARKFERKAELREAWIAENLEVIASDGPGDSLSTVSAALKRRGAIATDVAAHELRISGLHAIGDELLRLDYHGVSLIRKRKNGVEAQWVELKAQLDDHRANLERTQELFTIFKDMERAE
jgi:hypothetical protein